MKEIDLNKKKILVIRPDAIGDCINVLPMINTIKKTWPDSIIHLLVSNYTAPLLENHKSIDNILIDPINKGKNIFNYYKFYQMLKHEKYYAVIHSFNVLSYSMLSLLANIPLRIGDSGKIGPNIFHNIKTPQNFRNLTHHEVDLNLDLLKPLNPKEIDKNFYLHLPDESDIKQTIVNIINNKQKNVCIHTGSGGGNKPLDIEKYIDLIKMILNESETKIILIGSKLNEMKDAEKISELNKNNIINLAGLTSIKELIWIINKCHVFIGVDSGPMHIASALKKPVICIQPTNYVKPTRWGPYGTNNIIIRPENICKIPCFPYKCRKNLCVNSILPDEVFNAYRYLMSQIDSDTEKENLQKWLKSSMNVLLLLDDIKKEKLFVNVYNILDKDDWKCLTLTRKDGVNFFDIYKIIINNDINLIHYFGKPKKYIFNLLFLFSAMRQYIPPKLYIDDNKTYLNSDDIIEDYIKTLQNKS